MITDDTIINKLYYREFDNNKSYTIAKNAYNDILSYVFPSMGTIKSIDTMNGITIKEWRPGRCFRGINLNFWDYIAGRTCFRCIEFKGTAKDFKAKVLEKFEVLKNLRLESDNQTAIEGSRRIAEAIEIQELTEIAKRAFGKYKVNISKNMAGYRLTLEIEFNDKRELLHFCDKEE